MKSIVKNRYDQIMLDVEIRNIVELDIENGFLESLDSLRKASDLDREIGKDII